MLRSEKKMKKMKKTKKGSPEMTSLPDDLLLSCFARVSKMYYPTLSLVSKSYRSLLASPQLYKARSLLNHMESCLYVCLEFPSDSNARWFTLCQKPNKNNENESSGYVLASIPIDHSPISSLVVVGSNIYAIGGSGNVVSSCVLILDCQSHTWHEAPNMRMERNYPTVNVIDGKIYVAGGLKNFNSSNWMEVFDLKTQTWEFVLSPFIDRCRGHVFKSFVLRGRIFMLGDEDVAYSPQENTWKYVESRHNFDLGWFWDTYCVIDHVLYCYNNSGIVKWYTLARGYWFTIEGLKGLLPKNAARSQVKLAGYCGKMVVLWDKYLRSSGYQSKMIWCAVISFEIRRYNVQQVWGKVEWSGDVLRVPKSYKSLGAFAAIL